MVKISVILPVYNVAPYLDETFGSLINQSLKDIEIILVDDGSVDGEAEICDEYAIHDKRIKAIHKNNECLSAARNDGLDQATAPYIMFVDSDDWVETKDVFDMLNLIKKHIEEKQEVDLYITNYVYEHAADNSQYEMHYRKCLPTEKVITWKEMSRVKLTTIFLMHSLMYRLDKLKESKMELPSHTFYVDDIYAYVPLPYMKTIFYHDLDFYHYFIGRSDQSINYGTMCKRYEQQMRVFKIMFEAYSYDEINKQPKELKRYMWKWLMTICAITFMISP